MTQIEIIADLCKGRIIPCRTAGLPRENHLAAVDLFKESSQILDIFRRLRELRWALEKDRSCTEGVRRRKRRLPGRFDGFGWPKRARLVGFFLGHFPLKTAISRRSRIMRDHLPGLQRKLEIIGHLRAPFLECLHLRRIIERVLDLYATQMFRKLVLSRTSESASPHLESFRECH